MVLKGREELTSQIHSSTACSRRECSSCLSDKFSTCSNPRRMEFSCSNTIAQITFSSRRHYSLDVPASPVSPWYPPMLSDLRECGFPLFSVSSSLHTLFFFPTSPAQ